MGAIRFAVAVTLGLVLAGALGCTTKNNDAGSGSGSGAGGASMSSPAGTGGAAPNTTGTGTGTGGATALPANGTGGASATGSGGAPSNDGSGGAASTGGHGADGGTASDAAAPSDAATLQDGEIPAEQCEAMVMAAGTTVTDCEKCLCQPGHCQPELAALTGDDAANALIACTKEHNCSGACCLCGAPCDSFGLNYGMGPCAAELEAAAGATPGAGVGNAATVTMNCPPTSTDPNSSCVKATTLGQCAADNCADVCPMPPACE